MLPSLKNGNILIMKKYDLNLNYNDIVVVKKNNKIIIKRIVGLPKDTLYIDNYLYVNGKKYDDLIIEEEGSIDGQILLKGNEYFVLGDNRENSIDSRFEEIGIINKNEIVGKVMFK